MILRRKLVARQGMKDEDRVTLVGVQLAIGLIGKYGGCQGCATVELKWRLLPDQETVSR